MYRTSSYRTAFGNFLRAPDGGGIGAAPGGAKTFSPEYVHELREENKTWRQRAQGHETARKAAEESAAKLREEADARIEKADEEANSKIESARKSADEWIVRAELAIAAVKAGMVDLDGLKLADLSKVTLEADGTVKGADELMAQLKKEKPYLFGTANGAGGTSGTANAPKPADSQPFNAMKATQDEVEARKKRLLGRR